MLALPDPAGPISASLFAYLRGEAAAIGPHDAGGDPLTDRDLQLALYVAGELHYGGVEGVADELEWDPQVSALRTALQQAFLAAVSAHCSPVREIPADEVAARIFALVEADDAPPLSRFVETQATIDQFREFVIHRSAYQLREADPHTFGIPRIGGPAKAAMVEIQADEYGGGEPERMHSALFARTMTELGLDPAPGAYVGMLPAETLATVNLMTAFGISRRWRGAIVGHLAAFEITSSIPNRRYGNGLRRLGHGPRATEFYDEHVEADSVHENIAAHDMAAGLARQDPSISGDIVFGAEALLLTEREFVARILGSWQAGRSSLVTPETEIEPVAAIA